jgi:histidyl-tRNA synthetase
MFLVSLKQSKGFFLLSMKTFFVVVLLILRFGVKDAPKIQAQLKYAESQQIPFAVIFGPDEWAAGNVKVKDLKTAVQVEVPRADLAKFFENKK